MVRRIKFISFGILICFATYILSGCGGDDNLSGGDGDGNLPSPGRWELTGTGKGGVDTDAEMSLIFCVSDDQQFLSIDGPIQLEFEDSYLKGDFIELDFTAEITEGSICHTYGLLTLEGTFDSGTTAHGTWRYRYEILSKYGPLQPEGVVFEGNWIASYPARIEDTPLVANTSDAPMVLIPAGEFQMGDAFHEGKSAEIPVHAVYLDAFYMDVYEVTNARYTAFLNEYGSNVAPDGCKLIYIEEFSLIEKDGEIYRPKAGYEEYPIMDVTWVGAEAYAGFYGKRLPTEAEWEKAARGGLAGKRYPWGDDISHDNANYEGTGGKDVWNSLCPVGSFAPNGYGLHDMVGNIWEWCADWYAFNYYSKPPPYRNPLGPASGRQHGWFKVLRGGSCSDDPYRLRVAYRSFYYPTMGFGTGFRCAASSPPISVP